MGFCFGVPFPMNDTLFSMACSGFTKFEGLAMSPMNNYLVEGKIYNDCDTETLLYDSAVSILIPGSPSNNSDES